MTTMQTSLSKAVFLGLLTGSLGLAGCGSSDDRKTTSTSSQTVSTSSDTHGYATEDEKEVMTGRILITEKDSNLAHVYSIDKNKVIQTLPLANKGAVLYTSPNGRYALASFRDNSIVHFYDSGLLAEAHGDHYHYPASAVSQVSHVFNGVLAHYQTYAGQAVMFDDGTGKTGNPIDDFEKQASFSVISDATIATGKWVSQTLANNMHGTAEPVNDKFIIATKRNVAETSLPNLLTVYEKHDDHFHSHQELTEECPLLHGSATNGKYTVFGCADGIVTVTFDGTETFTTSKLLNSNTDLANQTCTNQQGITNPARIGAFLPFDAHHQFTLSRVCGKLYRVNPVSQEIKQIAWTSDSTLTVANMKFVGLHSEYLAILDNTGKVHILDIQQNFKPLRSFTTAVGGILVSNPNTGKLHIISGTDKKIFTIDPTSDTITSNDLSFTPANATWFGYKAPHSH